MLRGSVVSCPFFLIFPRISRLLDHLSDEDDHRQDGAASADLTLDVEDILALAMEERREKKEAEKVLSQLQENYDRLQRKYAEAENRLDKYRSVRMLSDSNCILPIVLCEIFCR